MDGQEVVSVLLNATLCGILRGLWPVALAIIRTTSHAGFPAWLVVFRRACGRPMKRHDDERTGWRDHGLQVRLVHP
jgi:hypothetical protein